MASSQKRRRELARAKYERQQQRHAEAQRRARRRTAVIAAGAAVVVIAAAGTWAALSGSSNANSSADAATPSATASASTAPVHVAGCTTPAAGKPNGKQWKSEPAMAIDTSANYTATLATDCGAITLKLDAAKAPHTVNSFVFLAQQHFFDHVKCHRLTTAGIYVLQCGDPTGTGMGGPGYKFKDENLASLGKSGVYPAGTVAMANSGPNTNGSQFFLVYKDSRLPPNYTPFGTITGGLDVLTRVAAAGSDNANNQGDGAPRQPVVMNSVSASKS